MNPPHMQSQLQPAVSMSDSNKDQKRLYITHVDAFGPYLRIYGHLNPDALVVVRNKIQQVLPTCFAIDPNWPLARQQAPLRLGYLCLYKRMKMVSGGANGSSTADCEFLRTRILSVVTPAQQPQNVQPTPPLLQVEVEFVDYGETTKVASYELLFPQQQDALVNIPTLCTSYIMLGVCKDFGPSELEEISRIVTRQTLDICIEMEFKQFKFITMKWKEFNFAEFLIHQKKIGAPIANDLLRDNFTKYLKQQQQEKQLLQHQQQQQKPYFSGSNNNNNNYYAINNNNNYNNANSASNNNTISGVPRMSGVPSILRNPSAGVGGVYADMNTKRSLSSRLQQYQPMQNVLMRPLQPRMPHTIGIHLQNNRIPYTPLNYNAASAAYNGMMNVNVIPSTITLPAPGTTQTSMHPQYTNVAYTRYQRPTSTLTPQRLVGGGMRTSPVSTPRRSATATFKSNNLTVGKTYEVCVSYVENGPCLFSVQLASAQHELTEMMNRIEHVQLKQFSDKPVLGTACIARYSEDNQLYRALITGVQPTACKVAYIDYGNTELVKFRDLYEIPDEFLEAKAFAIRFTLSGHKVLEPIDESLKKAFKDLMIYKNCQLKVTPLEGPPLVQYCELYMQESNILDVLKQIQKCRLVYPKPEALQNNDIVEIRYIDSPKHFYVQRISNIGKFEELMDDMYLYYNKNQVVPNHLALGAPCIVKYENEWYRAEVMRADAAAIVVRHVDFGYEQKVTKNLLSTIAEKHLKLPRQAVQCCLKGFENNELNKDLATNQFEMLAEESNRKRRSFTVKVFRIHPDGVHLVNLCTKDLNVMKKLYKLSMPFEQYLTLEKEEFNIQNGHRKAQTSTTEIGQKTPSIASSNEVSSVHSSKKGAIILNSTPLEAGERTPSKQQTPTSQKSSPQQRHPHKNSTQGSMSIEWDKNSSASSIDNRDSRSSSSEHKQSKRQQQQQQRFVKNQQAQAQAQAQAQGPPQNVHNVSFGSQSDRRSGGGGSIGGGSNYSQKSSRGSNVPPRFQNTKDGLAENRRQQPVKSQSSPQQSPRASNQRPQNAPQGYSQQSTRQKGGRSHDSSASHVNSTEEDVQLELESQVPEEYVPLNHAFPVQPIETPTREEVIICWWISPYQFYTHLKSRIAEFERLMREMQQFYKKKTRPQSQLKVGSYVVARYRKDNVLYRARILACNQMLRKYKVQFVDFGNQYTVTSEDIWQVEKRFASFPCMAYWCSLNGVVSNYDHLYIIDRMERYLPAGATLTCEYIEREGELLYYVNVNVNNASLKETLKAEGIITEVSPDLRLDLLAGQQVRARISSIKDMLNFKIEIEGLPKGVRLLAAYDDVRYVKSNPDIALKFRQFYEGKSCVVNVKDVNDNKVVLLRPLMPLLKDDIASYICSYPIVMDSFDVRVVYVASPYRLYGQLVATEMEMAQLLDDMYAFYQKEGSALEKLEPEQICAANGSDGNWYRARIVSHDSSSPTANDPAEVYYIDYGNTERLETTKLKRLEERFYTNKSAFAIAINLPVRCMTRKTADDMDSTVITKLKELTLNQVMRVKALEVRHNHLLGELTSTPDGGSVLEALQKAQLIKGRDLDHMRKQLDREKPNMFEYIEMVDLTLEDEDEGEKKQQQLQQQSGKNKGATSPKKKKATTEKSSAPAKAVPEVTESVPKISVESVKKSRENTENEIKTVATEVATKQPATATATASASNGAAEPLNKRSPTLPETDTAHPMPMQGELEPQRPSSAPIPDLENASQCDQVDMYADMEHAVLSHCDSPAEFYVHPYDKLKELRKLQEDLQIVASSLPPLARVVNGTHCIALYSVDKQWYRAVITDAEVMLLKFIDYGNTDCITDMTNIREMSVFPDIEPLCLPCALPVKPNGTSYWVDEANTVFNESYTKMLHFEYITRGDYHRRSFINLHIEGVNIAEKLMADGLATSLEMVTSGESCYISHVNGLTDFYIQYEKDSKALELIEIYLADNEKLEKLKKFESGKIVAALFPDDSMWYRAKLVKEIAGQGYEVLFIDYGNTSISGECREISQDVAQLPSLSKKCALELPEHCTEWSQAAEEKFGEIAALGETIFTVELREPAADHAIVHLLIDGHNINDDLELLCEKQMIGEEGTADGPLNTSFCNSTLHTSVYESGRLYDAVISHANSPLDFYVQFNKDTLRLEDMTNSLNSLAMEAVAQPEVGQICAAVFPEDSALYRARVLEVLSVAEKQFRVIFVDFGNAEITSDLRELPEDLRHLKFFSRHCQLEGVDSDKRTAEIFNELINTCEGLVKIAIIHDPAEGESDGDGDGDAAQTPAKVRLYDFATEEDLRVRLDNLRDEKSKNASSAGTATCTAAALPLGPKAKTCLISHAVSPSEFYIQPKENSVHLEKVMKALQKDQAEQLNVLTTAEVGRVCSAFSSEDDCYYRGRVQRVLASDDGFEIHLLDYGNVITTPLIREMSPELCSIPALAWKCRLNAIPEGVPDSVLEERFAALLEAHFGEIFEMEMCEHEPETRTHTVKLQVNYVDLAEELTTAVVSGGLSEAEVLSPVPTLFNCSVIHVTSPDSFYIQLADDTGAVERISETLLNASDAFERFTDLQVGAICAAQFPDDGKFYRAAIVQKLEDGSDKCEVHYLDFGNNSVTEEFRQLPDSIRDIQGYSKHCALVDAGAFVSAEAVVFFQTLIESRFSETFQVEFVKSSVEPQLCRLFFQDKNVTHELMQLLKEASEEKSEAAIESVAVQEADDELLNGEGVEESKQSLVEEGNGDSSMINPSSGVSSMEVESPTAAEGAARQQ